MACDISKGIGSLPCKNNVAGLRNLYIANYEDYDFELTGDDDLGMIIDDLPSALTEVFKYPLKNTGNTFTEESESSRDNGTTVWNQTLEFIINNPDAAKQFQIKNLVWGRPLIFVEDNSGDIFLMGMENGTEVQVSTVIEGEMSGAKNYQLEAVGQEREPIAYLSEDAVTALKVMVSEDNI